jgi:hypothetical protein
LRRGLSSGLHELEVVDDHEVEPASAWSRRAFVRSSIVLMFGVSSM